MGGGTRLGFLGNFLDYALSDGSPEKKRESSDILLSTKFLVVNFDSPDNRNLGHHLLNYSPDIFREIVVNKQIEIFDKKLCVSKMIFLFGFPEKKFIDWI